MPSSYDAANGFPSTLYNVYFQYVAVGMRGAYCPERNLLLIFPTAVTQYLAAAHRRVAMAVDFNKNRDGEVEHHFEEITLAGGARERLSLALIAAALNSSYPKPI